MEERVECIEAPYSVIDTILATAPPTLETDPSVIAHNIATHFKASFCPDNILEIPVLNEHNLSTHAIKTNSLVRYVGMIQDMSDPEWYSPFLLRKADGATQCVPTVYRDALPPTCEYEFAGQLQVRSTLVCVPLPGETDWARQQHGPALHRRLGSATSSATLGSGQKRRGPGPDAAETASKRFQGSDGRPVETPTNDAEMTSPFTENVTENVNEMPCAVHIFGENHQLRLCDMVDVVGIYTGKTEAVVDEFGAHLPQSGMVNVQCLFFRALPVDYPVVQPPSTASTKIAVKIRKDEPTTELNVQPFVYMDAIQGDELSLHASDDLDRVYEARKTACQVILGDVARFMMETFDVSTLRNDVISYFSECFGGDRLTAEYLLLHLISRVTRRLPSLLLGKLNLDIRGFPENTSETSPPQGGTPSPPRVTSPASTFGSMLQSFMASVVPRTAVIGMSVDTLNNSELCPHKTPESDSLHSGLLQLPHGTNVCIDSTVLSAGKLSEKGITALRDIQRLISNQLLCFRFPFNEMHFPSDTPVVLLNCAGSLVRGDVSITIAPEYKASLSRTKSPAEPYDGFFVKARQYIAAARNVSYSIPDSMKSVVSESMEAARKLNRAVGEEDMHRWLTVARLLCMSFGEETLTTARLEQAMELESTRLARNNVVAPVVDTEMAPPATCK